MSLNKQNLDQRLVSEAKKGNMQAFEELFINYQYVVYKLTSRYVADPSEVLDVTQETFIKVFRGLDPLRGDSSFYTWLYRIAINTAKNYLMTQNRQIPTSGFDFSEIEEFLINQDNNVYTNPEVAFLACEIQDRVLAIIDKLPDDLRLAILLREIDGLTYDEIALIMDCPVGTVRSRLFRAREAIGVKSMPFIH